MSQSFDRFANMKPAVPGITRTPARKTAMKKPATIRQPDYLLLTPLEPSYFGYNNDEVARMVSELALLNIKTVMADTGKELLLYARCSRKETIEELCTAYDIGGILVEVTAVYDQVMIPELAS